MGAGSELPGCDPAGAPCRPLWHSVTELVACRAGENTPEAGEGPSQGAEPPEVLSLLEISGESLRREKTRRKRWVAVLALLLLAAIAAVILLTLTHSRSTVTERGSIMVVHAEEQGGERYIFVDQGAHLLRLRCGSGVDWHGLQESAGQMAAWQAEYRWDKRTYEGELLRCELEAGFLGTPMDEVESATDLSAFDGDALFGYPRVMVKTLSRQPDPEGRGYLSTYSFYLGDDSADWYMHADEELLRVSNCLGYGSCGDGGFRTADFDGDGVRELLVRTPWPEKPCIVYDRTEAGVTETWLDELPEVLTGPAK